MRAKKKRTRKREPEKTRMHRRRVQTPSLCAPDPYNFGTNLPYEWVLSRHNMPRKTSMDGALESIFVLRAWRVVFVVIGILGNWKLAKGDNNPGMFSHELILNLVTQFCFLLLFFTFRLFFSFPHSPFLMTSFCTLLGWNNLLPQQM